MDRQDIDALLIGALYGELTPADEARLTAHLESHPGDRGALDDLKVARQAVAESRIFAVQLEPPQAVSALLLQEAHRRAPKYVAPAEQKESWFFRFSRMFLAHPAMAAAAMLVLVMGGAGIMYMKKGDQFATQEASEARYSSDSKDYAAAPTAAPAAAQGSAAAAGSGMNAGLYEGAAGTASISAESADEKAPESASDRWENKKAEAERHDPADGKLQKAPSRGIAVGTDKGMVKELDRAKGARGGKNDDAFGLDFGDSTGSPGASGGGGAGAGRAATGAAMGGEQQQGYAQPPPPAVAAPSRTATGSVSTTPPRAPAPAPAPDAKAAPAKVATKATAAPAPDKPAESTIAQAPRTEAKTDSSLLAWAKGEHARAVALAQKGECTAAAKLALGVSTRASEYYAQYMATDRALKQCAQYINAERDRDAEKSAKSRAQKRTNVDEAAPAQVK